MVQSSAPIVDRIRIIPRPEDFLDRNVGSSGELFYNRETSSLRVFNGKDLSGYEIARADLNNVSNSTFLAKANDAGLANLNGGGASVDVSITAPSDPESGNLWLNTNNGNLYIYVNDGDSSQWIQPAVPTFSGNYSDLTNTPVFASVAISGSYNDLTDTPFIPDFDGDYNSLSNLPDLGVYQLQSNAFSGSYNDLTDQPTSFSNLTLSGTTELVVSQSVLSNLSSADGSAAVVHDLDVSSIFNHSNILANFTANFTNANITNNRTIEVSLILNQGASPFIPSGVQVNSTIQTINWAGGVVPTGTSNEINIVNFTLLRTGNQWTVLGRLTTYG